MEFQPVSTNPYSTKTQGDTLKLFNAWVSQIKVTIVRDTEQTIAVANYDDIHIIKGDFKTRILGQCAVAIEHSRTQT